MGCLSGQKITPFSHFDNAPKTVKVMTDEREEKETI